MESFKKQASKLRARCKSGKLWMRALRNRVDVQDRRCFGPHMTQIANRRAAPSCFIRSQTELQDAIEALTAQCPHMARIYAATGLPPLRARSADLAGLAWIIVGQQVSTASAEAIYARVAGAFPDWNARALAQASDATMQGCGLSRPKIKTLRALGQAIDAGDLDFAELGRLALDDAHARLTALHGVGPWTADIFLLFCLGAPDAFPAGDLALQEAAKHALNLRQRPDTKKMEQIAKRWRPHRAAAARLLWSYYRIAKTKSDTKEQGTAKARKPKAARVKNGAPKVAGKSAGKAAGKPASKAARSKK
jgi:DNA-3-methyladenine glycosylase II